MKSITARYLPLSRPPRHGQRDSTIGMRPSRTHPIESPKCRGQWHFSGTSNVERCALDSASSRGWISKEAEWKGQGGRNSWRVEVGGRGIRSRGRTKGRPCWTAPSSIEVSRGEEREEATHCHLARGEEMGRRRSNEISIPSRGGDRGRSTVFRRVRRSRPAANNRGRLCKSAETADRPSLHKRDVEFVACARSRTCVPRRSRSACEARASRRRRRCATPTALHNGHVFFFLSFFHVGRGTRSALKRPRSRSRIPEEQWHVRELGYCHMFRGPRRARAASARSSVESRRRALTVITGDVPLGMAAAAIRSRAKRIAAASVLAVTRGARRGRRFSNDPKIRKERAR